MSVLVTGGTGFVGSWLVRSLVKRGEIVRVLVRKPGLPTELRGLGIEEVLGDVTDAASLNRAMAGVDTVYHLAGVVGYSRAARAEMDLVNVEGTRNVVDAIRWTAANTKLVYMSSVVAVGASPDGHFLNESSAYDLKKYDLGYFETKKAAEDLVLASAKAGEIFAVALCPSTIYGAGDAQKGSRSMQLKVARGKLPVYTHGGVSVVSVHDVIEALCVAKDRGQSGERYILAGENLTIKQLFTLIAEQAGVRPPRLALPNAVVRALGLLGDVLEAFGRKGPLNSENARVATLYHWFDSSKAKAELGFTPRPAVKAIAESVAWVKEKGLA